MKVALSVVVNNARARNRQRPTSLCALPKARQQGAFGVMAAPLLIVMLLFCGLAIDVGQMYARKAEMAGIAKAAAIAAARELNGTADGLAAARNSAKVTAERFIYQFSSPIVWRDSALTFSATPDRSGTWIPASDNGPAGTLFYAKVDTSGLDGEVNTVTTMFVHFFTGRAQSVRISDSAVAGRTTINVAPIAVCAMSPVATGERSNTGLTATELTEFGFRRGISYDLMQLNPNGTSPKRFVVNPVAAPGALVSTFDLSALSTFVCTGTMWIPSVTGGTLRVSSLPGTSPLGSIHTELNSRFDDFTGDKCSPNGAPPDFNIMDFAYSSARVNWMAPKIGLDAAKTTTDRNRLETIADLPTAPSGITQGDYGPLWVSAKAARYAASEPRNGYATFSTSDWTKLYKNGPEADSYPGASSTPYKAST